MSPTRLPYEAATRPIHSVVACWFSKGREMLMALYVTIVLADVKNKGLPENCL